MSELAGHLVDGVIPEVPVRQWVLSLRFTLRDQLVFDAKLTGAVLEVFIRGVFNWLRRTAARHGIADGQGGAITAIQRFGYRRSYCELLHEQSLDRPSSCGSGASQRGRHSQYVRRELEKGERIGDLRQNPVCCRFGCSRSPYPYPQRKSSITLAVSSQFDVLALCFREGPDPRSGEKREERSKEDSTGKPV
jgi:hypothetical protein